MSCNCILCGEKATYCETCLTLLIEEELEETRQLMEQLDKKVKQFEKEVKKWEGKKE